MQLIDALRRRKSVKRYSSKKPNWRRIIRAIDAARFIPAAGGQFAMKYILVSDKDRIAKLKNATQQPFVSTAQHVVLVVSEPAKLTRVFGKRGLRYSTLQAGVSIGNFMAALTEQGLVTKWIRHFYDEQVKEIFEIPEDLIVEGIFPIGLETKIKTPAETFAILEDFLYFDEWKNNQMTPHTRVQDENI